jgi:hypothetical protein
MAMPKHVTKVDMMYSFTSIYRDTLYTRLQLKHTQQAEYENEDENENQSSTGPRENKQTPRRKGKNICACQQQVTGTM